MLISYIRISQPNFTPSQIESNLTIFLGDLNGSIASVNLLTLLFFCQNKNKIINKILHIQNY